MKKNSKRFREILKNVIKDKRIGVKEALDLVKKNSTTKFDESIDVSLKINLKQSKGGDFSLRTVVNLPNGSGKKNKVAVLCEPEKADEAKKAPVESYPGEFSENPSYKRPPKEGFTIPEKDPFDPLGGA